ncbi:Curli assembly protein CsgE [Ulvibacter sp. MAR_2010_11]|uniref:CsgE family curli-type amyloid fiber assembly protein n=1 Tax=Ulvibacter sp. MAR_2010_11 TaxID=1250229 RepID=UPI000CAC6137|nr:CsgE family curli-type amyloid fiber assembly protein [Ulvibacter sp. MAR_2010_11]PKA82217.1 Curli assembly protein CsgE [Ulvibacter sp. MAR_2010_11]
MLTIKTYITFIGCLFCIISTGFSQIYNTEIEATINLEKNTEFIEITGSAYNKTEVSHSLRYVLSVIKNNPLNSNRSKNDQSGRLVLKGGEKQNLSKTTINANETDRIIILLLVYNSNDKLLGKDRIVINGTAEDKAAEEQKIILERGISPDGTHRNDDGVVLTGIVIEDTKTKPGRDFYKLFSQLYISYNINGDKIVAIKETLALANNTKIEILVDNNSVLEFFVRPQNDFLKAMADESIRRVALYLQQLKEEKNYVKRF